MADGSTKPIESINSGDRVLAFDESSSRTEPAAVAKSHEPRVVDHYYVLNETFRVSGTQPILSNGKWVTVADLTIGDSLTRINGTTTIASIKRIDDSVTVYNLSVTHYGTYLADGFVVHNKPEPRIIEPSIPPPGE